MSRYPSRIALFLIAVESSFIASAILRAPSEAASARFLGLSAARLVMLGAALFVALAALGVLIFSFWRQAQFDQRERLLRERLAARKSIAFVTGVLMFFTWVAAELAIYAGIVQEPVMQAVLMRLRPLLIGGALIGGEILVLAWAWYWAENYINSFKNKTARNVLLLWTIFLLLWAFKAVNGYGFAEETVDSGVFRLPGTPILGIQIIAALVIIFMGGKWLWPKIARSPFWVLLQSKHLNLNVVLSILIGGLAFIAWMSAPLKTSWFVDAPRPTNYTFSPNSDAYLYETVGQSLLAGAGFRHPQWGAMVLRPMYSAILALFHWIGGAGYEDIIGLQVAFLALFPVLIFNLTALLYRRSAGVLAALLIILREYNAIRLADVITVSHAKLLMADLPAALGAVLVLLLFIRWMQSPDKRVYPLLAGGAIGFFLLIRMETVALFSLLVFAGIYLLPRHAAKWFQGAGLVVVGFVLFTAPWVWRNWQQTQMFYIISPDYEKKIVDRLFGTQLLPPQETNLAPAPVFTSTPVENSTNSATVDSTLGQNAAVAPVEDHTWSAGEKLIHHFSNSQLQTFMIFPLSPRFLVAAASAGIERQANSSASLCCSPEAYVRSLPYWWTSWDRSLSPESVISMGAILFLSAVGIFALWRANKFLGLVPILFSTAYFLFLALMGRSGGRWILEVDWVFVVVYSAGIVEVLDGFTRWVAPKESQSTQREQEKSIATSAGKLFRVMVVILLLGMVLPLGEKLSPDRYSQAEVDAHLSRLTSNENTLLSQSDHDRFENLLVKENIEVWYGRALYPRFFQADDGMVGLGGSYIRPYPRMEFFLVGTENNFVVFPNTDAVHMDHAADVLLVGRRGYASSYFEILGAVLFEDDGIVPQRVLWSNTAQENEQE